MNWCRNSSFALAMGLAFYLTAAPALLGQQDGGYACTPDMVAGSWVYSGTGVMPDDHPRAGPRASLGIMVFDEQGRATSMSQTDLFADGSASELDFIQSGAAEVDWTVDPDCRGTMTFRNPSTGQVGLVFRTVHANGGREARAIRTQGGGMMGVIVMDRRLEPDDQRLEAKVDELTTELAATKSMVEKIARVLGLLRP